MTAVHTEALLVADMVSRAAHFVAAATSEHGVAVAVLSAIPAKMHMQVLVDQEADMIADLLNLAEMTDTAALDWSRRRSEIEMIPFHTIVSCHVKVKTVLGRRR